jgi:hypothetical protein
MTYRRLRQDELLTLEKDFIEFLASQSITAGEWDKMEQSKRLGLIDIFSDMVFEKVLGKVTLLEKVQTDEMHLFHFSDEKIILKGLIWKGDQPLDFTEIRGSNQWKAIMNSDYKGNLNVFTAEKKYRKPKKEEIFFLMEQGCTISTNHRLFQTLQKLA